MAINMNRAEGSAKGQDWDMLKKRKGKEKNG